MMVHGRLFPYWLALFHMIHQRRFICVVGDGKNSRWAYHYEQTHGFGELNYPQQWAVDRIRGIFNKKGLSG